MASAVDNLTEEPTFDNKDNKPTDADVNAAFMQPVPTQQQRLAEAVAPRPEIEPTIDETPWHLMGRIAEEDWALQNLARYLGREDHLPDPNFVITPEMYEKASSDGVRLTNLDELQSSVSQAEWDETVAHILQEQELDDEIAKYGWRGAGLRIGTSFMDPGVWGLAVATGGLGLFGKAAQVGRAAYMARFAGVTTAEAALIEAAMMSDKVTWETEDSLASVAMSFGVGASMGALFSRPMRNLEKNLEARAFEDAAEKSGVVLSPSARTKLEGERELVNYDPLAPNSDIAPAAMTHMTVKVPFGPSYKIPIRFDMMAAITTSPVESIRKLSNIAQNVVGDTRGGKIIPMSATEAGTVMYRRYSTEFMQVHFKALKEFRKELSTGSNGKITSEVFDELVERAVRRDDAFIENIPDLSAAQKAAVRRARDAYRQVMSKMVREMQAAGVKDADKIAENAFYVPRRIRPSVIRQWKETLGEDGVVDFIASAYRSGSKQPITRAQAQAIARTYMQNILRYDGGWERVSGGITQAQLDDLKRFLGSNDKVANKDIEIIEKMLAPGAKGSGSNLSRRLDLDETFELNGYRMEDLFESNAAAGMDQYLRVMTGRVQAAKLLGVRSDEDFEQLMRNAAQEAAALPQNQQARAQRDIRKARVLYRHLTGKPMDERVGLPGNSLEDTAFRLIQDYNYMRVMNQVGFAQFAEVGNTLAFAGWRATLRSVPALRRMIRDIETGQIQNNDIIRDLEAMNGIGAEYIRYQTVASRYTGASEEVLGHHMSDRQRKVLDLATRGKRVTSLYSGMTPITTGLQRLSASAFIQKMASIQSKALKEKDYIRFRELGWTDETTNAIRDQLKKATYTDNGRISQLNMDQWDPKVREDFANGLSRWTYRVIQENDPGSLGYFMTQRVGKIITQFRTFMLVAHAKQFLHGVQRVKYGDLQVANAFMFSTFVGGLAYVAQSQIKTIGDPNRDKLLHDPDKGYLAPENIAKSAFQRSAYSALIPAGVDTLSHLLGYDPVFAYGRSTGLASDALLGNPTVDTIDRFYNLPGNIIEGDFGEAAKSLPFQNALGITNFFRSLDEAD